MYFCRSYTKKKKNNHEKAEVSEIQVAVADALKYAPKNKVSAQSLIYHSYTTCNIFQFLFVVLCYIYAGEMRKLNIFKQNLILKHYR